MKGNEMSLSRQSLEILLDLIEIKVSVIEVQDKDDARELNKLRKCRQELVNELSKMHARRSTSLLKESRQSRLASGRRRSISRH